MSRTLRRTAGTSRMLPDRAIIQRATVTSDGGGGQTVTWDDGPLVPADDLFPSDDLLPGAVTMIPCQVTPLGSTAASAAGERLDDRQGTHLVITPGGSDITETDRLLIAGQLYEVTLVRRRGSMEPVREVEVREAV